MVTLGCDMVSVFISNMFPYCGIPRGRGTAQSQSSVLWIDYLCTECSVRFWLQYTVTTCVGHDSPPCDKRSDRDLLAVYSVLGCLLSTCLPVQSVSLHCTVLPPSVCSSIPRACRRVSSRVHVYVYVVTDKSSGEPRNHKYIAESLPRKKFPTIVAFHPRITTSMMQARSVKHTYLSVVVLHTRATLVCGRGVLREICMHGYQVPG